MTFKLSQRSLRNLEGVDERLVKVVKRAIELTKTDFAVIEGLRTVERQRELVSKGASHTMDSKHVQGKAVDLMAYIGARASWELNLYDNLADAMKAAAIEMDVSIRWGGAWTVKDIRRWQGSMESAQNSYIDLRRKQRQKIFLDSGHFELS